MVLKPTLIRNKGKDLLSSLPHELAHSIQSIYSLNSHLNAFTSIISTKDAITAYASSSKGPLHAQPIVIKDLFCTKRFPTTAASRMLQAYQSPTDSAVVQRILDAGGFIVGKTNMDEFGMGSANVYSHFGPVKNPFNLAESQSDATRARSAGGSSGGSAAAVASGMCSIAIASDTGGSTRLPAAYCGILGYKPSYGLISRLGMLSYVSSLDCVGIMAQKVQLVKRMLHVLAGYDERDPTSISKEARKKAGHEESGWLSRSTGLRKGLRIGVPSEYFPSELSPSVLPPLRAALRKLQSLGATLVPVSLPSTPRALSAYYVIASAEASSNLARYDGMRFGHRSEKDSADNRNQTEERRALYADNRSEGFGAEVQARLLLGTHALSAEVYESYYLQAQRVRFLLQREFDSVFRLPNPLYSSTNAIPSNEGVDVLLHPSAITTAPLLSSSPSSTTTSYVQDIMNVPASLAGLPALSVPCGTSEEDGWPVGVQVVGQWGDDELVLGVGETLME